MRSKLIEIEDIPKLRQEYREKKIVHCHGVFDLFHIGHLDYLKSAKKNGDVLFVSLTSDNFVNKGPDRPYFNELQRAKMLESQGLVDHVIINHAPTAVNIINILKPDFYIKGPDYKGDQDLSGNILKEKEAVERSGGSLLYTSDPVDSSSKIINKYFGKLGIVEKTSLEVIKMNISDISEITSIVTSLGKLNVFVVGEPIIDSYFFCVPENLSSKSASISANYVGEEHYPGGVWAVARHLAALGCSVELLAPRGIEPLAIELEKKVDEDYLITINHCVASNLYTPQKIRYISEATSQRMFELTKLDANKWTDTKIEGFDDQVIKLASKADLMLILDFGHGLWEKSRLDILEKIKTFKALNVQTNSGNYGYNFFHKHKNYDYISMDERELRLAMHDRFSPIEDIACKAFETLVKKEYSVTLGKFGSAQIINQKKLIKTPVFFSDPIDTTGAGDAFFTIAALLKYKNVKSELIPFIGNVYAGLKTKIIGNKFAVSRIDLIKSIESLLK